MRIWAWGIKWVGHLFITYRVGHYGKVNYCTLKKSAGLQGNTLSDHRMNSWPMTTWHDQKNNYTLVYHEATHVDIQAISLCKEVISQILPALWLNVPLFIRAKVESVNSTTEDACDQRSKVGEDCLTHYSTLPWPHLVSHDSTWLCLTLTMAPATCFYSLIDSTLLYHGLSGSSLYLQFYTVFLILNDPSLIFIPYWLYLHSTRPHSATFNLYPFNCSIPG